MLTSTAVSIALVVAVALLQGLALANDINYEFDAYHARFVFDSYMCFRIT